MIKLLVTGDFCPQNRIEKIVTENNLSKIYNDFFPNLLDNDFNVTNLECPLTDIQSPIPKVGPNLSASKKCIEAFTFGKFNLLTLSNNHILDQGDEGLFSTLTLCQDNAINIVGAGANLEQAARIFFKEVKNKRIAFLNFSETEFSTANINKPGANPLNPVKNYFSIKSAREVADYVIIIVHGGHEGYPLPSPRMVDTYRFFVEAGADIVIGHHSHCYSGYEKFKNGLIFYSLGNFIFDYKKLRNTSWNYGFALKLFLTDNEISFEIIPYEQCNDLPGVYVLKDSRLENFSLNLTRLNSIIGDKDSLLKEWEKLISERRDSYLINFECFNFKLYKYFRHKKYLPSLLSKNKILRLRNLIECEAHHDLVLESFKVR